MTQHDFDEIKKIFDRYGIKSGIDRFHIYLHAVIAQFVFDEAEGKFANYSTAWSSASAAVYKKYLKDVAPSWQCAIFDLCDHVHQSDGLDFINEISPDLFPGDISAVLGHLGPTTSRRPFIYNLLRLYGLHCYRSFLYEREYLAAPKRLSDNEVLSHVSSLFDQWEFAETYKKLHGFSEKIQDLWLAAYGVPFLPEKVTSKGVAGIMKELSSLGFSTEEALELFYICKTSHSFDLKKIDDPFSYFRKIMTTRVDEELQPAEDGKELSSPGTSFYLKEDLFNTILSKWRAIDTVDFVRSIYFKSYSNNLCAETALATPHFFRHYKQANNIVLFDANPDLILKISEIASVPTGAILFVQSSKTLAMLYKQRFPNLSFAFIQKKEEIFELISIDTDENHGGRETRFIALTVPTSYDMFFVFARNETGELLGNILNSLSQYGTANSQMLLFCPNSLLDTADRSIRMKLSEEYDYIWIQILPSALSSAWLKKNLIVGLSKKKAGPPIETRLFHAEMYTAPGGESELICQDPWPVKIPQNEFIKSPKTVKKLWEQFRAKPKKGAPRSTKKWRFSEEISLWYSWSNTRGRVQYYGVPTEKQLSINPLERGKRLTPCYPYTAKTIERAEFKFSKEIWGPAFKPIIVEEIIKAYKRRPMTLKTFWYCYEDDLKGKSGYNREAAEKLFTSPQLSELLSDGEHPLETYQSAMEVLLAEDNKKDCIKAWQTLNAIIMMANHMGRFLPNTVSDYVRSMIEKDRGYQAVRKNLAKRSYEIEEENKMLHFLHSHLPTEGAFVGAAISFYCGIVNRQICALTWGDYQKFLGDEASQLWITKTLTTENIIRDLGTEDKNMLRRVPAVKQLMLILDARLDYVKKELALKSGTITDKELNALPIVTKDDLVSPCTPADIKAAKSQMEGAANIEPMEVSIAKIGAKATDLNEYSGDRFRSNFLYRALQTCHMSRAEANYIYGISLPTTFSIHYCDYTNDFSQLMLCRKLERWTSLHQRYSNTAGMIEKKILSSGREIRIDQNAYYRSAVELRLNTQKEKEPDTTKDLIITINDDRGVNLTIRKRES